MINNLQAKKTEAKKVEKRKIIVFIIMLRNIYTKLTCGKTKEKIETGRGRTRKKKEAHKPFKGYPRFVK